MRRLTALLLTVTLALVLSSFLDCTLAQEPSLQQWFDENSYVIDAATNKTGIASLPAGNYSATILTELAYYAPNNTFGWYSTTDGTYHELFSGQNASGATVQFSVTESFGMYLSSPAGTFHTEKSQNTDSHDHAWVYQDPKSDIGYIVAWEDLFNGGDEDYQDMVLSLQPAVPPHAVFTWHPHTPLVNETVTFNASESEPDGGYITSYAWDFGDDHKHTTQDPITTHAYSKFGNYEVDLNITDSQGMSDSVSHSITVIARPNAAFTYSPMPPRAKEDVIFNATESTANGGSIISYEWNFSDGSPPAFGAVVTHRYTSSGSYTASLNVTDSEGLWDTEAKIIEVQEPAIEAEFAVKIQDEWTQQEDPYVFTAISYCTTFKVDVIINDVQDLYGYEFWLEFDPAWVQLVNYEVKHIHSEDNLTLLEVNNTLGVYKQALVALSTAQPYNGSATVASLCFHITNDPCYPDNFTGVLMLENTKMNDKYDNMIDHLRRDGYLSILSVKPSVSIEHEEATSITNWIANSSFTVDIKIFDIVRMNGFCIEINWGEFLETDIQIVDVTSFLPQPYETYRINVTETMLGVQVKMPDGKPPVNGTGTFLRVTFKAKNPWNGVPHYSLVGNKYLPDTYTCKVTIKGGWIDVLCPTDTKMEFCSACGIEVNNDFTYTFAPIQGDLNLDGEVNILDLSAISQWAGVDSNDTEWAQCHEYDLTGDGSIDIFDIIIVSSNMGRTHP
jgi:PKD repeat protein